MPAGGDPMAFSSLFILPLQLHRLKLLKQVHRTKTRKGGQGLSALKSRRRFQSHAQGLRRFEVAQIEVDGLFCLHIRHYSGWGIEKL